MKISVFIVLSLLMISGCSSSKVIETGPQTYTVSTSGAGFSTAGVRQVVYEKANEFCTPKGLVMFQVSYQEEVGRLFLNPPSALLVFRCNVKDDKNKTEAIENNSNGRNVKIKDIKRAASEENKKLDLHSELLKLDDLRKRGLLSNDEFNKEKKKLLQ